MKLARAARDDLEEIQQYWLERAGEKAAQGIVDGVLDSLARLEGFAARGGSLRPELGAHVRLWPAGEYIAYYRERQGGIEVMRVLHGSRDRRTIRPLSFLFTPQALERLAS